MKKILLFSLIILSLSSCLTVGRIERNCDKFAQICITPVSTVIKLRDTIIYRSDTILIKLPTDTVQITDTIIIVKGMAYLPPINKKFGLITASASVDKSVLRVRAWLNDSTFLYQLKDTIYIKDAIREESKVQTVTVKHIPKFYKFTFCLFIFQVLAFGLYQVYKKILKK